MKFRVWNTQSYLTQEAQEYLRSNGCKVSDGRLAGLSERQMGQALRGMDAVIAGGERYTRHVLDRADRLKIVARAGAGVDRVDLLAATEHGVWVTNTLGANSMAVAEYTIGLILCLLRNLHGMAAEMKRGQWRQFCGRELGSLTLGVVGTGSIGREVIRLATGFGGRIVAYDICQDAALMDEWKVKYLALDDLLQQADVVSLHLPLNEQTKGLIDARRLGLMQETAYLVNTSRPGIVDRQALREALSAHKIAGAALDVHDPAPCAPADPLVLLDNVLATPWSAFYTEEAVARMSMAAVRDVVAVLHGGVPQHPVNQVKRWQRS